MSSYTPPFIITPRIVNLIAEISVLAERFAVFISRPDTLLLRRANRIKSIHSSLAIEGNPLSEEDVADILDGKTVVAPPRQIQEVKNAIAAYELWPKLDPFSVDDLLKTHDVLMSALVDAPGEFRRSGVAVMAGSKVVHMAPPADRVPFLVQDLFAWLKAAEDHLLVKSCVFHYEFEFIHPFPDGNGRMGRLWQSLILGKWHSAFQFLPIENMAHANQQKYYDALNESGKKAGCTPFLEFMLGEILRTLQTRTKGVGGGLSEKLSERLSEKLSENERLILYLVNEDRDITAISMAEKLKISRQAITKIIAGLKAKKLLRRVGGAKGGHWKLPNN